MSNASELLKLKELLDKQVITQDEFEKMKKELLKSNNEPNTVKNHVTNTTSNPKKGCLNPTMLAIIIVIVSFIIVGQLVIEPSNEIYYNNQAVVENLVTSYDDFSNTIQQCGFSNYTLERDTLLDELDGENTVGIRIKMPNINGVIYLKNGNIHSIRYADNYLYKDGIILHTLSEYIRLQ